MDLTFTLICPRAGGDGARPIDVAIGVATDVAIDVVVGVEVGTPLRAVADELTRAGGRPGAPLYAGSQPVRGDAVLGEPPLRSGAILGLGSALPPHEGAPSRSGLLELRTVGGPDAGGVHALTRGTVVLGRDQDAGIRIADPDLSRHHAELQVGPDGVQVRDRASTNGSHLDGTVLGPEPVPFGPGALLRAGESTLTIATPDDPPAATRPGRDGRLLLNRPPRLRPDREAVRVLVPAEPPARSPSRLPVLSALLPLLAGVAMAVMWHAPQYLLFTLLSPVLLIANAISERRGLRRGRRRELAGYEAALASAQRQLDDAIAAEAVRRRQEAPDLARLWRAATGPGQLLWERRRSDEDALRLRIGLGSLPAQLRLDRAGDGDPPEAPVVPDVPATVDLRAAGVLGVAGPEQPARALLRSLVLQVATLHGPHEVALALLCDEERAQSWSWARWLPHLSVGAEPGLRAGLTGAQRTERVAELVRLLDARAEARGSPLLAGERGIGAGPDVVVVIDRAAALRDLPGLARLLADGPQHGIYALCLDTGRSLLPAECGATVEVVGEVGTRGRVSLPGRPVIEDLRLDGASAAVAEQISRAISPLQGDVADAAGTPPDSSRLLPLLSGSGQPPGAQDILAAWGRQDRTTSTVIGESATGPYSIDLASDGPHALIAGTTGAGKSELLQTIIAGLAAGNRPEAMTFVLIDYKGGAAFKDCVDLPHTVGMVTDLDAHLTERALTSLTAELRYREQLLAAAGAKDIEDYRRAGAGPLPRLVLVIDEFASLAEELPDFVTGLVGIAMRGRSLGIHLILATQRPSGVVSPVIRANTNLRIALRVTDDGESRDVIDTNAAARIPQNLPGRAYARTGSEPPAPFQTARVGGRAAGAAQSPVRLSPWPDPGAAAAPADHPAAGQTDLQQLVRAIADAARAEGRAAPRRPWLPPLPERITLADLPAGPADAVPFALSDHPREQRRDVVALDLAGGDSMAIVGGPRSGRSAALRSIAASAALRYGPQDLHLYVLDCAGGAQAAVRELPHCGAVCERHDVVHGDRVLSRLAGEVTRRQELLAAHGFASAAQQRAHSDPAARLPWIVVLVDGWEGFIAAYEAIDHGRPVDTLLTLAREGAAVGVRVVVAGGRPLLTGRVDAVLPYRIVLRLADGNDYTLAGLPRGSVPERMADGRGVLADGATELQVALLEDSGDQIGAVRRIAARVRADAAGIDPARLPFRISSLPQRVTVNELTPPENRGPLWTPIGIAGDSASTVGIDLSARGPGFLIAGPAGSGRSTALLTMAVGLIGSGARVVLIGPRRSPLRRLAGTEGVAGFYEPGDAAVLDAEPAGPCAYLVDDVPACTDTATGDLIGEVVRADDGRRAVVGAGRAEELIMLFRGPVMALRSSRCGLLLSPGPQDGELLGVRVSRVPGRQPPGRGILVMSGEQTAVQVAVTGESGPADERGQILDACRQ